MANKKEEVIMFDAPEAAHRATIEGWMSRRGLFYPDRMGQAEDAARYDGCTHRKCQSCDVVTEKLYTHCKSCREKNEQARYLEYPSKPWEGEPLFDCKSDDRYFFHESDLEDYCFDEGISPSDMQLVICEPSYPHVPDPEDFYSDILPEDGELSDNIKNAFADLERALKKEPPVSWFGGKYRAEIPQSFIDALEKRRAEDQARSA